MYVIIFLQYKNEVISNSEKESNEIKMQVIMQINKQINACV